MADMLLVEKDEDTIAFTCAGVDLSAYDSISLELKKPDGTIVTHALVIDDAAGGLGHFQLATGDIDEGNTFGQILMVLGGHPMRFPKPDPFRIYSRPSFV